jgi:hypothetical protein
MTRADFSPARFQPLDGENTEKPRSPPGTVRKGVNAGPPGKTIGAWISSATTRTPNSSASAARVVSSSREWTVPVGFCGLHSRYAARSPRAVASRNAVRRASGSRRPSAVSGASTVRRPMASRKP